MSSYCSGRIFTQENVHTCINDDSMFHYTDISSTSKWVKAVDRRMDRNILMHVLKLRATSPEPIVRVGDLPSSTEGVLEPNRNPTSTPTSQFPY